MSLIPGINIQYPWSELIVSGDKTIETRTYKIPEKFVDVPMAIIETPGKHRNIVPKARIVGIVVFSGSKLYSTKSEWKKDFNLHRVQDNDAVFRWSSEKEKWGWIVKSVHRFDEFLPAPKKRGIVFATSCEVPTLLSSL